MKLPVNCWIRRAVYSFLGVSAALGAVIACGTDKPGAGGERTNLPSAMCGTPNEGCDCPEPGAVVPCGQLEHRSSDGFVDCSMGHRTCLGTHWGACVGEGDIVTKSVGTGGGITTMSLGGSAKCGAADGGPADPCDPYCNAFVDDPIGLPCVAGSIGLVDGGFAICPGSGGDGGADGGAEGGVGGGVGPTVNTTATGDSTCPGGSNLHGGPCTLLNQFTACQQDFRCDPTSLTCQWNGPNNYFDPGAGGADLTVGAGCDNGTDHIPVCNRGSVAVASGATITINLLNPAQLTAWNTGACPTLAGPPDCSKLLAAPLNPGECVDVTGCALGGNAYAVVNSEAAPIAEAAGRCANNVSYVKTSGPPGCAACTLCNTKLTGKVYDPSGFGGASSNNLPLANIDVFEPTGALVPLVNGVSCETCASLASPSIVRAVTDATGAFSIDGVTPGTNVPIVVQSGKWRRKITMAVPACATTAVPSGTLRLPANRTDGFGGQADIPRTAIELGASEALECFFLRMGISLSEFAPFAAGDPHRFRLFSNNGLDTSPGSPAAIPNLFVPANLNEHSQVFFDCDGATAFGASALWSSTTAGQKSALQTYTSIGGSFFVDHLPGQTLIMNGPAPFSGVTTWNPALYQFTGTPAQALVYSTPGPAKTFYDWLNNVGAMVDYGPPYVKASNPRQHALNPVAAQTTQWMRGESSNNWGGDPTGDYSASFSYEMGNVAGTPTINANCGVPSGNGRVFFNGMHVSQARAPYPSIGGAFPTDCNTGFALTPEEKAIEYQIIQLTACQLGGSPPPVVPPLPVVTFYRDYQAVCGVGERVKWAPFYWQGAFAAGTSVDFRAATADTQPALPASPPAAPPATAAVATTTVGSVINPAWDCNGCPALPVTVDSQLKTDTGTPSKSWLRIYMKFNPNGAVSPVLTSWRQVYDCVPAE